MQAHLSLVPPNPVALAALGTNYGVTWPQRVVVNDMGATRSGGNWVPNIRTITAEYSRQARVLAHQQDITAANIPALALAGNFQAIINGLNALGNPGAAFHFYSLAAVVAHESQHAVRCRQALDDNRIRIEAALTAVTVPIAAAADEGAAVTAIQALPAFAAALDDSFNWWDAAFDAYIANDHVGNDSPCNLAERRVVTPLVEQIRALAVQRGWVPPPAPVAAPAGSQTLAQRIAAGGWH